MELNRTHLKAVTYYDFKLGLTQQHSLERFRDQAPSWTTVFYWVTKFRGERQSLDDDEHCSRSASTVTNDNIVAVRTMGENDARILVAQLER